MVEQGTDAFQREAQLFELLDHQDLFHLLLGVVAVAGFTDGRAEDVVVVVVAQLFGGEVAKLGHLSDGELLFAGIHGGYLLSWGLND